MARRRKNKKNIFQTIITTIIIVCIISISYIVEKTFGPIGNPVTYHIIIKTKYIIEKNTKYGIVNFIDLPIVITSSCLV